MWGGGSEGVGGSERVRGRNLSAVKTKILEMYIKSGLNFMWFP